MPKEPSFCIYNKVDDVEELKENNQDLLSDFCFGKKGMGLIEEDENEESEKEDEKKSFFYEVNDLGFEENEPVISSMEFATGFGGLDFDGNGDVEEYYKRVLEEDPSNPLFLRNYARLLQSKRDLSGAEQYYFQATLYAKLVWQLHRDKDRASDYFERAVRDAPENSHILAAYASFLWDINDDDSDDEMSMQSDKTKVSSFLSALLRLYKFELFLTEVSSVCARLRKLRKLLYPGAWNMKKITDPLAPLHLAAGLGIGDNIFGGGSPVDYTAAVSDLDVNSEEYYDRMIKENPHNPVLLRNYAQFLSQSKGDLQGAEEYYSRAILADPTDGETISHYVILTWQLHHDKHKASSYFERAIHASPEDSDVLAAYARFLWQTDDNEDEGGDETFGIHNGSVLQQEVVAANA
ncbi:unnamed protein product [Withania somnifera]